MQSGPFRRAFSRFILFQVWRYRKRPFILGIWINRHERLGAKAISTDLPFVWAGFVGRPTNGWSDAEIRAFIERLSGMAKRPTVIVWGYRDRTRGYRLEKMFPEVIRLENGLIPGRYHKRFKTAFIVDRYGAYFDGRTGSAWEDAVQAMKPGYARLPAAQTLLDRVRSKQITKYRARSDEAVTLPPRSLLILGQRNGDQAINLTETIAKTNREFIRHLYDAAPIPDVTAHFYKPHPRNDNDSEIGGIQADHPDLVVIDPGVNVHRLLAQRPRVATITSGAGLEAALHGCEVYTFGLSFYSNFGFTIDHFDCPRRTNRVTAEDIAAFMWMGWTVYVDPKTRRPVPVEAVFDLPSG